MKPVLLEICDMPSASAGTTIKHIHYYLNRVEIPHVIISEHNIADIVRHLQSSFQQVDVVLCEHGLFDCLTILRYYYLEHHISPEDYTLFANAYLNSVFTKYSNYVLLMNDSNLELLYPQYSLAKQDCLCLYENSFKGIQQIDTKGLPPKAVTATAVSSIIDFLKNEQPSRCTN